MRKRSQRLYIERIFFTRKRQALLFIERVFFATVTQDPLQGVHAANPFQRFIEGLINGDPDLLRDSAPGQEVQMSGVGDHPIQIEYNGIKVHLSPPW